MGASALAARYARKPIINAGDGVGEHPTQALLDLFTIREELNQVDGLVVTMLGDLKYGRTVHSLARLLALFDIRLNYISPEILRMPPEIIEELNVKGIPQAEFTNLEAILANTDVLYVTRVQKERFENPEDYEGVKDAYVITTDTLSKAKERMIVMHPLPRVGEIAMEVDNDPRAAYFRQMEYGLYVRMALLAMVLGKA
jgi:aspartate carbamoyltransferase